MTTLDIRQETSSNRATMATSWSVPIAVCAALIIGLLSVSSQSLWIDELGTWRLTQADSLGSWLSQLLNWSNSDAQLPLYHAWVKLWLSVFGSREWVLRSSNVPWLALTLYAFWRAPVERDCVRWVRIAGVVCALHPLTWYYTSELRPYLMMLSAAALAGVGLMGVWHESGSPAESRIARHFLIIGLAMLSVTSAIGAIWTLAFLPAAVWLGQRSREKHLGLDRSHALTTVLCLVVVIPVFAQYVSSFLAGVTATTLHEHKIVNFIFAFYELLGLSGVGPGRDELRVAGVGALRHHVIAMGACTLVLAAAYGYGLVALFKREGSRGFAVLLLALVPVLILYGLAEVKHWRVVGRHMVPFLFFICVVLAAGIDRALSGAGTTSRARALMAAAVIALVASSLSIRFAERHQREMTREAAAEALGTLDKGGIVWWFADANGPEYEGLGKHVLKVVPKTDYDNGLREMYMGMVSRVAADCSTVVPGTLLILENTTPAVLGSCPPATLVVLSRRDTFDVTGAADAWLKAHGMQKRRQLNGFEIWE